MLRRDARIKYPGACSLEFQSVMQILTEYLLKWDTKRQTSKGKRILGTVLAFAGADDEQGCETLHRHWLNMGGRDQPDVKRLLVS